MGWTDLSAAFAYGSKLTSAQMQNLRDNVIAVPDGDSGAPRVQNAAIQSHSITWQKFAVASGGIVSVVNCVGGGGGMYHYEIYASDGNWYRCSDDISGGGA